MSGEGWFTAAVRSAADRHRTRQEVGAQVIYDCEVYGMSIWRRNEDGDFERADPAAVVFHINEQPVVIPTYLERMTESIVLSDEDEQRVADLLHRELTDSEEAAEEATWD